MLNLIYYLSITDNIAEWRAAGINLQTPVELHASREITIETPYLNASTPEGIDIASLIRTGYGALQEFRGHPSGCSPDMRA